MEDGAWYSTVVTVLDVERWLNGGYTFEKKRADRSSLVRINFSPEETLSPIQEELMYWRGVERDRTMPNNEEGRTSPNKQKRKQKIIQRFALWWRRCERVANDMPRDLPRTCRRITNNPSVYLQHLRYFTPKRCSRVARLEERRKFCQSASHLWMGKIHRIMVPRESLCSPCQSSL